MSEPRFERVRTFLECARALTEPGHALRAQALRVLPAATGLSLPNVVWALENAFEVNATDADLGRLCARTPVAERAHVLLSANVFVAALRAIAIGLASAPKVFVRSSRREPEMLRLLAQAAPDQFATVETLDPRPGDHCWAYGSDATMAELGRTWPTGITLHAHGSGFGIAVLEADDLATAAAVADVATRLAVDVAAFDQRGCLSPRLLLVENNGEAAQTLARALAAAMAERERQIPRGALTTSERAEIRRFHDTMCMTGTLLPAGSGWVTLETEVLPVWPLPPIGRVLHIRTASDASAEIREHVRSITTIGVSDANHRLATRLTAQFPTARIARIGCLQCPPLDGPVDLR